MVWTIEFIPSAEKELAKLDKQAQLRILKFLTTKTTDPKSSGKALTGNLGGYWRYRIGPFRVIAKIEDEKLTVLIVKIGHRKNVYKT